MNTNSNADKSKRAMIHKISGNCMVCMGIPDYKIIYDYDGCSKVERYCNKCLEKEKENDEYSVVVNGFVWDAKFIDFVYDKSGIIFSKHIYELDEEYSNELERLRAFEDTD